MAMLAGSLYLIGTLAFVLVSLVIGVRLCRLSRRTGERPELYLGLGILGAAVLGYGVLVAGILARGGIHGEATSLAVALTAAGKVLHDAGVTMILLFVLTVFRRRKRWARVLFAVAVAALWGGMIGVGATGGFHDLERKGFFWWLEYAVIWTYPIWPAVESFRYWRMMKRRQRLGLADPLVTNRFLLWALASTSTLLAIWVSSSPMLMGDPATVARLQTATYLLTALFGIVTVGLYGLTFFPPRWYRDRLAARATSRAAPESVFGRLGRV
jgi:hypothetical protein